MPKETFNPNLIPDWVFQPGFAYDMDLAGYLPGNFGCRAGPSIDNFNLYHEISHAIELSMSKEIRRLKHPDYGFRVKSGQTIMGRFYPEPKTRQISERENRAFAIQSIIDPTIDIDYCVKLNVDWMADYYMWKTPEEVKKHLIDFRNTLTLEMVQGHWIKVCKYISKNVVKEQLVKINLAKKIIPIA